MIWKELGISPDDSLNGTTVLNTMALIGGCDILRVHDVKEATEPYSEDGELPWLTIVGGAGLLFSLLLIERTRRRRHA
jgi:hypothetical protein